MLAAQRVQDVGAARAQAAEEPVEKLLRQAVPLRVGEVQTQAVGLLGGDSVVVWVSAGHRAFFLVRPGAAARRRGKRLGKGRAWDTDIGKNGGRLVRVADEADSVADLVADRGD